MADTQYLHPNNTYIVSAGLSNGQLIRYQYYNNLADALTDAGAGTLIISYDTPVAYTHKAGVKVVFMPELALSSDEIIWKKIIHEVTLDELGNLSGSIVYNDTGIPVPNTWTKVYNGAFYPFSTANGSNAFTAVGFPPYPEPEFIYGGLQICSDGLSLGCLLGVSSSGEGQFYTKDLLMESTGENLPTYIPYQYKFEIGFTVAQMEQIERMNR